VHITVINPNTTRAMTDMIGSCARGVAAPGTRISAVNPSMGPASIESHYDEALSVPGLLHEIAEGERAGSDGYVIACFGDPGLDAARELAGGPVVGIAEAAMHAATLVGRSFSVVTSLSRTVGRAQDLVRHYGFAERCVGVYACDIPVLALDDPATGAAQVIIDLCRQTVERDKADSIVLGCAGMADLCSYISGEVGVPVIDGVSAATKLVESLVTLGYSTSRRDEFARPLPKSYVGGLAAFELVD
jgi:allantoin racemase